MSIIKKIMNSTNEGETSQLVEEHVIDVKTITNITSQGEILQILQDHFIELEPPGSWGEEAELLERNGEKDKADILRAAEKRWFEIEYE